MQVHQEQNLLLINEIIITILQNSNDRELGALTRKPINKAVNRLFNVFSMTMLLMRDKSPIAKSLQEPYLLQLHRNSNHLSELEIDYLKLIIEQTHCDINHKLLAMSIL